MKLHCTFFTIFTFHTVESCNQQGYCLISDLKTDHIDNFQRWDCNDFSVEE